MKVRHNYLIRDNTLADAGSYVYNLDVSKPISAITLFFNATTNTPAGTAAALLAEILDIQVVDGSRVIQGGNGDLLHGMMYGLGHPIGVVINSENTTAERADASLTLYFGRYIGDKEYYLDPTRLTNPQLRFTSAMAVGAGYFTTGTLVASVVVHTIEDGGLSYKGCFTTKQIAISVLGAAGETQIEMPTDYPWLTLGCFCQDAAGVPLHPYPTLTNLKVSQNNEEYVPYDLRTWLICKENYQRLGVYMVSEEEWFDWAIKDNMGLVAENITLECHQVNPYGGMFLDFANPQKDDFWVPGQESVVRAIATGGATGGSLRYLLSQVGQ